jgi:hypothetical protein
MAKYPHHKKQLMMIQDSKDGSNKNNPKVRWTMNFRRKLFNSTVMNNHPSLRRIKWHPHRRPYRLNRHQLRCYVNSISSEEILSLLLQYHRYDYSLSRIENIKSYRSRHYQMEVTRFEQAILIISSSSETESNEDSE